MGSLKDALMKAGFKSSPTARQNERPPAERKNTPPKKVHEHQTTRNFCEVCERTQPDVEHYKHRNPVIAGRNWICIACADKNEVPDATRTTAQSDSARKGMFRRYWGATNSSLRPAKP